MTLRENRAKDDASARVAIYRQLSERLQRCAIVGFAVTSIADLFCIETFGEWSPAAVIDRLDVVKQAFMALASPAQGQAFLRAGAALTRPEACEVNFLAGTDRTLAFKKGRNADFRILDSARPQAAALATAVMTERARSIRRRHRR